MRIETNNNKNIGASRLGRLFLLIFLCSFLPLQDLQADNVGKPLTGTAMSSDENGRSWIGLDLGSPYVITSVGWRQQETSESESVVLGLFEGSNREDFMDAIPLYMIKEEGTVGEFSYAFVRVTRGFRYVRWVAPADTNSSIAEVEFYGYEGEGNDNRFYQLTNLPTLSYHTYSGIEPYDKVHELESEMCIIYDGGTRLQEYPILARERGNGSRYELFKKRPYRIKFNDGKSHHMLRGSSLESPAKAKKWTLIPNWRDKSLMRNNVAFEMSRRLGLSYTPWIQNVDVIVNGQYKGNYQLCDQVTVDPNRVEITDMLPDDIDDWSITGGYLMEITSPGGEAYHFSSNYGGIPVDVKSPDADDIVSQQFNYIRDAFNEMESRLWASNYMDATEGYRSRLDLESFLRLFLVGEFAGNNDAMWSIYLYKEREDDLFHFGPVWDFDLSMDNDQRTYPANGKPDWLFNYGSAVNGIRSFVNRILSDPYANERLATIWSDLRESKAFSEDSLWAFVDSLGNVMDESQKLNFTRWDNLDQLLTLQQFAPGTYQGELDIIKNYLKERIRWIDNKLGYEDYEEVDPSDTLYVIDSPMELLAFQQAVNRQGLTNLNGRVEADLDLSTISTRLEPIGTSANPYTGTFDGQGHTFSHLTMSSNGNYVGLFGVVSGGATIKNFVLDETCSISGNAFVGIIGGSNGSGVVTMESLGNEGSVTAIAQNAGGIFGCNMNAAATPIFRNCYVTGDVKGDKESGQITGYAAGGQAYNCYASGSIEGYYYQDMSDAMLRGNPTSSNCYSTYPDRNVTVVDETQVASGELCYMLNQGDEQDEPIWYQTLEQDEHPVLQHHLEVTLQEGEYVNKLDFVLSTPQDVINFARLVNTGLPKINGIVTADLDFQDLTITPIGTAEFPYVGCFDGQGHTFSNLTIASGSNYTGLFGIVSGGVTIKNFVLDETCSIRGSSYVGIIGGSNGSGTVTMERLGNEGSVTATERNAGGIFGCNMSGAATPIFINCYVSGPVKGKRESGQITGYAARGYAYNCYGSGSIEGYYYQDMSDTMLRGNPNSTNCYSTYPDRNATVVDETQVSGGELCYLLNQGDDEDESIWYQTLGLDGHPVLNNTHAEIFLLSDGSYINWDMDNLSLPSWAEEHESYSTMGLPMKKNEKGIHIIRTREGKSYKVLIK